MEVCCLEQPLPSTDILFAFSSEGKMEIGGENSVPSSSLPFAALAWGIFLCLAVDLE